MRQYKHTGLDSGDGSFKPILGSAVWSVAPNTCAHERCFGCGSKHAFTRMLCVLCRCDIAVSSEILEHITHGQVDKF